MMMRGRLSLELTEVTPPAVGPPTCATTDHPRWKRRSQRLGSDQAVNCILGITQRQVPISPCLVATKLDASKVALAATPAASPAAPRTVCTPNAAHAATAAMATALVPIVIPAYSSLESCILNPESVSDDSRAIAGRIQDSSGAVKGRRTTWLAHALPSPRDEHANRRAGP